MPNSPVAIATASVTRLVKEEASYRSELQQQQERVRKLEAAAGDDDDGNREYVLRQEKAAVTETEKVFPSLRTKIQEAIDRLDALLQEESAKGQESNVAEIDAAKEAIARAKTAVREIS